MLQLIRIVAQGMSACRGRRWRTGNAVIFAAIVELLWFTLGLSWVITAATNPSSIGASPIIEEIGYVNPCVGWDSAPASYVALPLFVAIAGLTLRYVVVDAQMFSLDHRGRASSSYCILRMTLNALLLVSILATSLIFLVQPTACPACVKAHTALYIQLVLVLWLQFVGIVATSRFTLVFSLYFGVFTLVSLGNVVSLVINVSTYHVGQTAPFVPPVLGAIFDWGWFVTLSLASCALPYRDESLEYSVAIVPVSQGVPSCWCGLIAEEAGET